jgi:hypothetical protein
MGYWAGVEIHTGKEYTEVCESINHTSNTGKMWAIALGIPLGDLHHMECRNAADILHKGVKYMRENKEELEKLNPENGWGDYDTALEFLTEIRDMADAHPKARLDISY